MMKLLKMTDMLTAFWGIRNEHLGTNVEIDAASAGMTAKYDSKSVMVFHYDLDEDKYASKVIVTIVGNAFQPEILEYASKFVRHLITRSNTEVRAKFAIGIDDEMMDVDDIVEYADFMHIVKITKGTITNTMMCDGFPLMEATLRGNKVTRVNKLNGSSIVTDIKSFDDDPVILKDCSLFNHIVAFSSDVDVLVTDEESKIVSAGVILSKDSDEEEA